MNPEHKLTEGDHVFTKYDRFPISTGVVEIISNCERYARVRKKYGHNRSWTKIYNIQSLERCVLNNEPQTQSKA